MKKSAEKETASRRLKRNFRSDCRMATKTTTKTAVKHVAAKASASKNGKVPTQKQWVFLFTDTKSVSDSG